MTGIGATRFGERGAHFEEVCLIVSRLHRLEESLRLGQVCARPRLVALFVCPLRTRDLRLRGVSTDTELGADEPAHLHQLEHAIIGRLSPPHQLLAPAYREIEERGLE